MAIGQSTNSVRYEELDLSALTEEERRELKVLWAEANERQIEIPAEIIDKSLVVFPKDSSGYYVKRDGKFYVATDSQAGFVKSVARFVLYYGGRGSGKSAAGAQKALRKIEAGYDGTIINPKFEDLKTSTWEEFRRWIPPASVIPRHRYRLESSWEPMRPFVLSFMNGAKVYIKGLKDPDSARGANVNWLWYDEGGSDVDGKGWRIAIAAVRVGFQPQAWVTSTPNGVLHWMHDFFMDEERIETLSNLEEFKDSDRPFVEVFRGSMEENKKNLDPTFYVSMQSSYVGWEKQQEVEGEFVSHGGSLGDATWFDGKVLKTLPENLLVQNRVRYWDLAASEKKVGEDPDRTVGSLLAWAKYKYNPTILDNLPKHPMGEDAFFIEDQTGGYWEWLEIKEQIWKTAVRDGYFVKIRIEQEPASGGKNQVAELIHFIQERCKDAGMPVFNVEGHQPEGDKVMRANVWFAEAKMGKFYLLDDWFHKPFLKAVDGFPLIRHDDEVDSVSGARLSCAPIRVWKKIDFLSI